MKPTKVIPEICENCGEKTTINYDVGYDIGESYEERQHIEVCKKCKKWRFANDALDWETGKKSIYRGTWDTDFSFLKASMIY